MPDPDQQRLAAIAARAATATPGPWRTNPADAWADPTGQAHRFVAADTDDGFDLVALVGLVDDPRGEHPRTQPDAEFIANSRADVPWLLDQLQAWQQPANTVDGLREQIARALWRLSSKSANPDRQFDYLAADGEGLPNGSLADAVLAVMAPMLAELEELRAWRKTSEANAALHRLGVCHIVGLVHRDRLGYLAASDEWTDMDVPLTSWMQPLADLLATEGRIPDYRQPEAAAQEIARRATVTGGADQLAAEQGQPRPVKSLFARWAEADRG